MNKKIIIIISVSLFLLLSIGISVYLISKDAMLIQNPLVVQQKAMITYSQGETLYKGSDSEEWNPVEIGMKIEIGHILKTLGDGELDIRFSENTLMKMDNNTILYITDNTLKNLSVKLNEGKLFARFHKLFSDQKFSVESGNTVAGVRGTDLVFQAFPEKTDIYALSGITEIYNKKFEKNKILLAFQKKTTVNNNSTPTQPADMDKSDIIEFQQILNLIHSEKVFMITNNILFNANTSEILPSSYEELAIVLGALKRKSFKIEIAGHTANVGSSSAMYGLSLERAQAIKDYLIQQGISPKRMEIRGYGGSQPLADNNTAEGKALNRRVEFIIRED